MWCLFAFWNPHIYFALYLYYIGPVRWSENIVPAELLWEKNTVRTEKISRIWGKPNRALGWQEVQLCQQLHSFRLLLNFVNTKVLAISWPFLTCWFCGWQHSHDSPSWHVGSSTKHVIAPWAQRTNEGTRGNL